MKKIKYRGLVDGKIWYTEQNVEATQNNNWEQFWTLVDKKTVQQYIGVKDNNGVDVYEGDVCVMGGGSKILFVVEYINKRGAFAFVDVNSPNQDGSHYTSMKNSKYFTIKNNILDEEYE